MDLDTPFNKKESDVDSEQLLINLEKLEASLKKRDPDFPKLSKLIHSDLSSKPELAHILTPEQVRTYVSAASSFTQVQIVQESARKKTAAKVTEIGLDDL